MTTHYSSASHILRWSAIFICLGVIFFFLLVVYGGLLALDYGGLLALDDAGLSHNSLARTVVFGLLWPPYVAQHALGWFIDNGASSPEVLVLANSSVFGPLLVQVLGWGFLGIPLGFWRAKRRTLAPVE
jgi:hypothetical protein